jgi:hypothetical protein
VTRRHFNRKPFRDGAGHEVPAGYIPRVARLMALATRCTALVRDGVVVDQSGLARFGQATTAPVAQAISLLNQVPCQHY